MLIKKRADQLVPGDIVVTQLPGMPGPDLGGPPFITVRRVVLRKEGKDTGNDGFITVPLDVTGGAVRTDLQFFQPHAMLDVEVPDLTPAQAHAEELVQVAHDALNNLPDGGDCATFIKGVLDKINPPKPPTLGEVLAVLVNLEPKLQSVLGAGANGDRRIGPVLALLERARRSGVLK